MLAERCPNCGAFLPVRQAGVTVRTCEFCGLEVPGGAPVVEVPSLTARRPAVVAPPATASSGPGALTIGLFVATVLGLVAVGTCIARSRTRRPTPPAAPVAEVPAEAEPPAPPAPPVDPPARVELRAAIAAAGGPAALDAVALLGEVDARVRAEAPDALLLLFRCTAVRGGRADLAVTTDSRCTYEYRSPARSRRPADVPEGVRADVPCQLWFGVDAELRSFTPSSHSYRVDDCRRRTAVRPPVCTLDQVWERALAAGVPPAAVASLAYGARYRSPYDPVDPADDPDRPERGRWSIDVERDGAPDVRVRLHDDCGHELTAAERAVQAAVARAAPALRRCHQTGAAGHPAVEAFEMIWRLAVDARGAVSIGFRDPGIDIEGMFSGDLDAMRTRFADCADAVARRLRLPPELPALRVELRVTPAAVELSPPPFD